MSEHAFDHSCEDRECPHFGQRTFTGCGCHKTCEQMMGEEVVRLRARVSELLQSNNEFEERARKAERQCKILDASLDSALKRIFELIEDQTLAPALEDQRD